MDVLDRGVLETNVLKTRVLDTKVLETNVLDDSQTYPNKCNCQRYFRATNFKELITLIKDAELMMIKNGITDIGNQINCLRGIYYGSTYSLDYSIEKSELRNKGFTFYTTYSIKFDAREKLKCCPTCTSNLFQALYDSAEIRENLFRILDIGHLLIGLDARRNWVARNVNLPLGGTGLENVTFMGDLGGGIGMLALKRVKNPAIRAKKLVFDSNNDFGCPINMEGDMAAYYVGLDITNLYNISNPENHIQLADYSEKSTKSYLGIHAAIQSYMSKEHWPYRAKRVLIMLGFEFDNENILTNRTLIISNMIDSLDGFAKFYLIIRSLDKNYNKEDIFKSFAYINSCAQEVCNIWVDAMLDLIINPSTKSFKANTDPNPTQIDLSNIDEIVDNAKEEYDKVIKWIEELK